MAKINKYEPYFDEDGTYMSESTNGDYIKVSELRELLLNNKNIRQETLIETPTRQGHYIINEINLGVQNYIDTLLAAIDTEVK